MFSQCNLRVPYYSVLTDAVTAVLIACGTVAAQVMPTPVAMESDISTTASYTTSTLMKSETPQTSATKIASHNVSNSAHILLTPDNVDKILSQAEGASSRTVSFTGLRSTPKQKRGCRHHIFVVDRNGKILGRRSMPDAWTGSIDIALGKARTAAFFSSDENALTTRQIGDLALPHGPTGDGPAGPLYGIANTNRGGGEQGDEVQRNGVVTFAGGVPLYKEGKLVGAIGVSGDNPNQDESVAYGGAEGFMPPPDVGTPTPLHPKPVDWFPPR